MSKAAKDRKMRTITVTVDDMTLLRIERYLEAYPHVAGKSAAIRELIFHGTQRMWDLHAEKAKEAARG